MERGERSAEQLEAYYRLDEARLLSQVIVLSEFEAGPASDVSQTNQMQQQRQATMDKLPINSVLKGNIVW